jgi:hypothetical protein
MTERKKRGRPKKVYTGVSASIPPVELDTVIGCPGSKFAQFQDHRYGEKSIIANGALIDTPLPPIIGNSPFNIFFMIEGQDPVNVLQLIKCHLHANNPQIRFEMTVNNIWWYFDTMDKRNEIYNKVMDYIKSKTKVL